MKVLLGQNSWAPVTVAFVVAENRNRKSQMFVSKFEVTEKNVLVWLFFSRTNTTQQLHLLKFYIEGSQILS